MATFPQSAEIDSLLNKNWNAKLQWLDSIWEGRDRIRARDGLSTWDKDPIAANFLLRDKVRKKRKRWNQEEC